MLKYLQKTPLLFLLLNCFAFAIYAQKPLTPSRQSSYYTYIYRLDATDVLKFHKYPGLVPDEKILHFVVDSFKTDGEPEKTLPPGNYLEVHAEKNRLHYKLIENHSVDLKLMRNDYDMPFALLDKQGNEVTDAVVHVNNRLVRFDNKSALYHVNISKKNELLRADYQGVANFFLLKPLYSGYKRNWLRARWYSFRKIFRRNNYYHNRPYERDYLGFMVFNKAIYKPHDTVKFKAFILEKKSKKPIDAPRLLIRLKQRNDQDGKIIGYVNSYRPGGYESNIALNDSLKLELDDDYTISLEDPGSAKYGLDKYDGTDEDKFLAKRKVYFSGDFKYEDYELESIHFSSRTDKKEHWPGNPLAIYLKATDENDLPVADGRVTLTLTTRDIQQYAGMHEFVPDTLWIHKLSLDPAGETKVVIPDSIFPKASITYHIDADFLNSNNERQSSEADATHSYKHYQVIAELKGDTLVSTYQQLGKEIKGEAMITGFTADDDTISNIKVTLPSKIIVNPNAASYNIEADSAYADIDLKNFEGEILLSGYRTPDSLFVNVANDRHLHFWYSVFSGNKLLDAGESNNLFYREAYQGSRYITFVVNYIWAGQSKWVQSIIPFQEKLLNVYVKQPVTVYPGQQVRAEIAVTDQAGKPVANTDITAWSMTRKFTLYQTPYIPYLGKISAVRKNKPRLRAEPLKSSGAIDLDWARWSRGMGLDSITYYQFTHPQSTYRIEEAVDDTLTQIAPFIVNNGDVLPVHILFIDERPVYFSQSRQMQRYSFAVKPGKHNLRFRTTDRLIKIDSVSVEKYKKLIISINADTLNKAASIVKMPDTLSRYEAGFIDKYLISVVDNFGGKMALLAQDDKLILLNKNAGVNNGAILAGPLSYNYADFILPGEKTREFLAEPDYNYVFEPGLLKQKSIDMKYPFSVNLNTAIGTDDYTQHALTKNEANDIWEQYLFLRSNTQQLFVNQPVYDKITGRLEISVDQSKKDNIPLIKNIILYRYDNPDFIMVFPGNTRSFGPLAKGRYRMLFLLKGDSYDIKEDLLIKPFGCNYFKYQVIPSHPRDSVSIKINKVIASRRSPYKASDNDIQNDALKLKEAFNDKYFDTNGFNDFVSGYVTDANDKQPVPGATVKVKGTNHGVVTDINGHFRLRVPASGKLIVAFIGYVTSETTISPEREIKIKLTPAQSQLNEVVVVGYSTMRKMDISGSVSVVTDDSSYGINGLQGRAAGVVVESAPGGGTVIYIRGNNSISTAKPLIVVDGEIVDNMNNISPADIGEITVLKDASATALYGSRAANGVIVINTKRKAAVNSAADTTGQDGAPHMLRKNFSDYAYWQPKLTTDAQGKASFVTTFPDDITNWRTFVIAVNGQNKQTGFKEGQVKSFRPVSANFVSPTFAVRGDQMNVIGKVMNYTSDTVKLNRMFSYNDKTMLQGPLRVKNALIDTMHITAEGADSLTFEYTINRDNGYFDGERRKIPVIEQGTQETKGIFEAMDKDTTVTMKFDPALGPVTFRAEASVLPALLEETERLRTYQYLCNEQLASKLIGLLSERRIKEFLGMPFEHGKNVTEIIKKIQQNRRSQGTWGWWKDTDEELWVSLHAVEALLGAEKEGYQTNLDKAKLTSYLVYQLDSYKGLDKLNCLELLKELDAKVDYAKYADTINKAIALQKHPSRYDQYRLLLLKQQAGLPVKIDTLFDAEHHTLFGNCYWGEDSYRFFENSIQMSVLAYKIIRNEGKHPDLLAKIRGYFLEQRRDAEWRNTYESSLILETILSDLLTENKEVKPAAITLSGAKSEAVAKFPYTATFTGNELNVTKTGTLPVYITGYQQFWNRTPEKVSRDFTVNTWFEKKGDKITKLKGGEPIQLQVQVTARGDADYVMINIPIPAGCSYESKEQPWQNEVHREYFKDRVCIFSRKLKQGTYLFTVSLMPRYDGVYNINPAKAEMMYFPVFYGRESMKKVVVGN